MIKQSILSILGCFLLCSCSSCSTWNRPAFPHDSPAQLECERDYQLGRINYQEYDDCRKNAHAHRSSEDGP
jgi:hypothetical protein